MFEPKPFVTDVFVLQVSAKETASQSADSPATDVAVSSSRNGALTSGTSKSGSRFALSCEESRACVADAGHESHGCFSAACSSHPLLPHPHGITFCFCICCYATISTFFILELDCCFLAPHRCVTLGHFCQCVNIRDSRWNSAVSAPGNNSNNTS